MGYDLIKEKREAIQAGECALRSLRAAKEELDSARRWGIYDILGGGMVSTFIKHGKMDRANEYINRARADLRKFSTELGDVSGMYQDNINVSDFLSFADYFLDGFVADYLVQDKINTARMQVDEAISRVESILNRLRH